MIRSPSPAAEDRPPARRGRPPRASAEGGTPTLDSPAGRDIAARLRETALDLFSRHNYSTVTIKDIADASGINPSLIYYYFGNKEGLFLAVVESTITAAFSRFEAISRKSNTPEAIVSTWIEIHILQYPLLQKLGKISLDYANMESRNAQVDTAIKRFYRQESAVLKAAIRQGIADGTFRPVNPEAQATFISTFLDGCLFRQVIMPNFNPKAAIRHMRALLLEQMKAPA